MKELRIGLPLVLAKLVELPVAQADHVDVANMRPDKGVKQAEFNANTYCLNARARRFR
ncbi:MAG TPA: hypothetical protein VFW00_13840 [Rhodocyclaceae bacterium]|nr:hypothetical protein [Rhodocyclaceae bacterium]